MCWNADLQYFKLNIALEPRVSLFHLFSSALFSFQQTQDASFLKNLSNIFLICRTAGTKPLQEITVMLDSSSCLELVIGCLIYGQKDRGSKTTNACLGNRELFPSAAPTEKGNQGFSGWRQTPTRSSQSSPAPGPACALPQMSFHFNYWAGSPTRFSGPLIFKDADIERY